MKEISVGLMTNMVYHEAVFVSIIGKSSITALFMWSGWVGLGWAKLGWVGLSCDGLGCEGL